MLLLFFGLALHLFIMVSGKLPVVFPADDPNPDHSRHMVFTVFLLLLFIGFNHWLANFFALILGIGVGFKGGGIFVFRNANPSLWLRFVSLWCCVYVVIGFFIGALRSYGLSYYVSGLVALPISALFSYFGQKYFVFGRGEGG